MPANQKYLRKDRLDLFMNPRSVAIVGASRKSGPGSFNLIENMRAFGYDGEDLSRQSPGRRNPGPEGLQGYPGHPGTHRYRHPQHPPGAYPPDHRRLRVQRYCGSHRGPPGLCRRRRGRSAATATAYATGPGQGHPDHGPEYPGGPGFLFRVHLLLHAPGPGTRAGGGDLPVGGFLLRGGRVQRPVGPGDRPGQFLRPRPGRCPGLFRGRRSDPGNLRPRGGIEGRSAFSGNGGTGGPIKAGHHPENRQKLSGRAGGRLPQREHGGRLPRSSKRPWKRPG